MKKLVICSVGTSISDGCPSQKKMLDRYQDWDAESDVLEQKIKSSLNKRKFHSAKPEVTARASAELNSLHKLGINTGDKVVLLSEDSLHGRVCAEMIMQCLQERFSLLPEDIEIRRIDGLQGHDERLLRESGLKNLVAALLSYLANDDYRFSYDIIINPSGGCKGIIPFLTVMGMLFGRKVVCVFDHSEQLVTLPPLPFPLDPAIYKRVRDALRYLEEKAAVPEQDFFSRIQKYEQDEHDLFTAFVEPTDDVGEVTISPLGYCLLQMDSPEQSCYISDYVIATLEKVKSSKREKLNDLMDNISCPNWRNRHLHRVDGNDLLFVDTGKPREHFAGFMKDKMFYLAMVFLSQKEYKKGLAKYSRKSFANVHFWKVINCNFEE